MIARLLVLFAAGTALSCASTDKPPKGPESDKTKMPWNPPVPGQGGGAYGALPQQPRR